MQLPAERSVLCGKHKFQSTLAKHWIAVGRAEGEAQLTLKLLQARFGTLDEAVTGRVLGAAPAQVARWVARPLSAASLA